MSTYKCHRCDYITDHKSNIYNQKPAVLSTAVAIEPAAYHELLRTYGRDSIIRSSHLLFDSS